MQSDIGSPSPSQQSEESLPPNALPTGEAFVISPKDATILEEFIEEFKGGDEVVRSTIIATAMGQLCALRPPTVPFNKIEASRVCVHVNNI
jgi:hypothetical protein